MTKLARDSEAALWKKKREGEGEGKKRPPDKSHRLRAMPMNHACRLHELRKRKRGRRGREGKKGKKGKSERGLTNPRRRFLVGATASALPRKKKKKKGRGERERKGEKGGREHAAVFFLPFRLLESPSRRQEKKKGKKGKRGREAWAMPVA